MNENSSQTIKELSEDQEIKNSSELDNDSASQNEEDLSFEKSDIPSADSSSSRTNTDFDNAGFTQEEFASLLGKYDYNFKPGDLVKGTVFALEPKGAMIDIGAKTAAFMPVQEVSINRVEGLNDVLQPSESREFIIMSEENEVAYIRYASVYRKFNGVKDFISTLESLKGSSKNQLASIL